MTKHKDNYHLGLCSGCGKVHLMGGKGWQRAWWLTELGFRMTDGHWWAKRAKEMRR